MSMVISCKQQYLSITTAHTRCEYGCWDYDIVTLEYERKITAKWTGLQIQVIEEFRDLLNMISLLASLVQLRHY